MQGNTMSEKRQYFLQHFDWIRTGLMFEPRGHDMMSGIIFYPPSDPQNDTAILFIETSGCLPMCGHGTIGAVTVAIEEGLVSPRIPGQLRIEVPAGLVQVTYQQEGKKVKSVEIQNVKSFLAADNLPIHSPALGDLTIDVAYGGNFYAIVDPQANFKGLENYKAEQLISWSRELRTAINEAYSFVHPENPTIRGVSHVMWTGKPLDPGSTARNAVFYGDKAIDRSPCGTGTSARLAQWHANGKLRQGECFIHESIIGSKFIGKVKEVTTVGDIPAIVPTIQGQAWVYGYNTIIIDDDCPYAHGFQVI